MFDTSLIKDFKCLEVLGIFRFSSSSQVSIFAGPPTLRDPLSKKEDAPDSFIGGGALVFD